MTSTNGSLPPNYNALELQASGMVSVQAHCTTGAAMLLMKQRALDDDVSLGAIAAGVLDRTMRFGD